MQLLQSKAIAIDNDLRGCCGAADRTEAGLLSQWLFQRNPASSWGAMGAAKFGARIELVEDLPDLAELVEPLLIVRGALRSRSGVTRARRR